MDEELMLVTFLHDVGKILQRAGIKPKCELSGDFYEHDRLTCDFLNTYLDEEYVKLFKEGRWKIGDYASASERIEVKEPGKPESTPLLDPTLDIQPNVDPSKLARWYSVTYVDFNAAPETYKARRVDEAFINYKGIYKILVQLAERAREIVDAESLLETYDYIYRTVALFVPAAVYKAIPNTSLYGHSRLAAPLAVCKEIRLLVIDIKGIQRFITNIRGEAESSKRLRGRSFFLQLLQRALSDNIADVLGLSVLHNISFEPGKLIFVVCDDVKDKVDEILVKVEEWSNYELQFASSISNEKIKVSEMKIFSEREEDRSFKKALENAIYNLRIVGKPHITEDVDIDYFGDVYPRKMMFKAKDVEGMESLTAGEIPKDALISEINLISLIVGHSTRNLKYVIEIMYKDNAKGEMGYRNIGKYRVGEIYIEPLNIGFLLVHGSEKDYDIAFLKSLIQTKKEVAKRIRIFTVNNTLDFIYPEFVKEFSKISFGYITLSTYHPVEKQDTSKLIAEKFKSLDDMANYIALGITDGDRIGEIVKNLSAFPGRFMTFSSLLDFTFAHIVTTRVIDELKKRGDIPIVVLYSGGDDLAIYGKWDDVLILLAELSNLIVEILPSISVSGGIFIFKKKYPIAFAYAFAKEYEGVAKKERDGKGGRISSNIFEKYTENEKKLCEDLDKNSLTWSEAAKFLEYAKKSIESNVPSAYLYKVYNIGQMIEDCEIPKALVTYAYLNARNERVFKEVKEKTDNYLVDYPGDEEREIITRLLKFRNVVNMYTLLKRT
ncbi:Cas10/Cmr2 second palm domain-containing protein [Saccharolobus islandicus]|uniref:Cas10/Cmr2 second palm domain-containing protein n=1 Tax=Saccharolobus islandicus TaxID=43080 RepID=UPI000372F184|nr:hypothetical protein [Sulfolobus islandicus]